MKSTAIRRGGNMPPYRLSQRLLTRYGSVSGEVLAADFEANFRGPATVRDEISRQLRGLPKRRGRKKNIARDWRIAEEFERYLPLVRKQKKKGALRKFKRLSPDHHNRSASEIAVILALQRLGIAMTPERGLKIVQGQKRRRNNGADFVWRKTDNGVSKTKMETTNERPSEIAKGRVLKPHGS